MAKVAVVAVTDDDIRKKNEADHLRRVFDRINTDGDGLLQVSVKPYVRITMQRTGCSQCLTS